MSSLVFIRRLLVLLLCMGTSLLSRAAWVTGLIQHGEPGAKVEIQAPHYYLDGRSSTFSGVLDAQSRFALQVEMPEPNMVFLLYNDDHLPLFLTNDDTLYVKSDAFQFPVIVAFDGEAAAQNHLLQEYLKQNRLDFNEFNNIRFKIGQAWISLESDANELMESLTPELFKGSMDARRDAALAMMTEFNMKNPGVSEGPFYDWITAQITYSWAYQLLVYGQVYGYKYDIQPDYFRFLDDAPIISDAVNSEQYRQFIMAFMARQQAKTARQDNFWAGEYELAGHLLAGRSLAFFRSEMIATAFSAERFSEILPLYTDFLQHNPFPEFDDKVSGLYQKYARVFPGAAAPAFSGPDRAGKMLSLSELKGKIVYLNFWASWCGACLRKMDYFDEFEPELAQHGIEIVNISIDEKPANWENALTEHLYRGRHLLASAGQPDNIALIYGVQAVPQYFIIDRNGLFAPKSDSNQPNDIRLKLLEISSENH